jgi:hypothetical protein
VKQIRKRLTYANVMSSIAVFLVIGGASALAASHLGKNSVGSKQLQKNAVTSAKIKNNAVTTAKIKNGAVSGAKINLGSLGTVPTATNAVNATNATNAGNANTVNGQTVAKVFKTMNAGESNVLVASIGGFTITASCESVNVDATFATPASPSSVAWAQGNGSSEGPIFEYDSEKNGTPSKVRLDGEPGNAYGVSTFAGSLSNGQTASGVVGYDYGTFANVPPEVCIVSGHITVG